MTFSCTSASLDKLSITHASVSTYWVRLPCRRARSDSYVAKYWHTCALATVESQRWGVCAIIL